MKERKRDDLKILRRHAILRADGSFHLGMGHIMRCLAFADGLNDAGVASMFVTKAFDPRVTDLIRSRGYDVEEIPSEATATDDVRLTREVATRNGAKLIVTDLCHQAALANREELDTYHRSLMSDYFLICLAGGDAIDLPAHIVVSPYFFRTTYPSPAADNRRILLLGPSYFIFRREFVESAQVPRTIAKEARRVLVTVGGGDELHLTSKIVRAFCALSERGLSLRIVLGPTYSDKLRREVSDLLIGFKGEYALLDHKTNMAEAMLWADLAITGDGLTKYETAVTGTPSIMLSRPNSEKALNKEFEKAGTTLYLGDGSLIDIEFLADKIQEVLQDYPLRMLMSQCGKALVDGQGLKRIIAKIPPGVLR